MPTTLKPTHLRYYRPKCGLKQKILRILAKGFAIAFPRSRRRILLLSSLMPILFGAEAASERHRSLVNTTLSVAQSDEALLIPIYLYQLIYSEDQISSIVSMANSKPLSNNHECVEVASHIYKHIPSWILYEEPADVVTDITTLLALRRILTGQ